MTPDAGLRRTATEPLPPQSRQPAAGTAADDPAGGVAEGWTTLVPAGSSPGRPDAAPSLRRVLLRMIGAAAAVALLVGVAGSVLSRRIAENQAVHDVAQLTDVLADSVVQPSLTDAMAGSPTAASALDGPVRARVLSDTVVRVKLWSPDGTILYSDEPRLTGRTFTLDSGAREALSDPQTRAEVSDVSRPENEFERGQRTLLEVYRPVWTPGGRELLFETYFRYDVVADRTSQLWRGFAGITLSAVAVTFLLFIPVMWTLLRRARAAQSQREAMIRRSLDASLEERQRIAAALHDGIVQEVAAASFAVAAGAQSAHQRGDSELAARLDGAASAVRSSMSGLRSLVVDIYPPSLQSAGLGAAIADLLTTLAGRGPAVTADLDPAAAAALTPNQQEAMFRIAQEALRNVVKHARAEHALVRLTKDGDDVVLEVSDDGGGFDPSLPRERHLGVTLMSDVARAAGGALQLRTGPGLGTSWRFRVASA
jgi:signal transduction histidine kinase